MSVPEQTQTAQPNNVTLFVSITSIGEGEEPLVAVKIKADGQEVKLPLAVFMGEGMPFQFQANMPNPQTVAQFASAFQAAASNAALALINAAERVQQLRNAEPIQPMTASPAEESIITPAA